MHCTLDHVAVAYDVTNINVSQDNGDQQPENSCSSIDFIITYYWRNTEGLLHKDAKIE